MFYIVFVNKWIKYITLRLNLNLIAFIYTFYTIVTLLKKKKKKQRITLKNSVAYKSLNIFMIIFESGLTL